MGEIGSSNAEPTHRIAISGQLSIAASMMIAAQIIKGMGWTRRRRNCGDKREKEEEEEEEKEEEGISLVTSTSDPASPVTYTTTATTFMTTITKITSTTIRPL